MRYVRLTELCGVGESRFVTVALGAGVITGDEARMLRLLGALKWAHRHRIWG